MLQKNEKKVCFFLEREGKLHMDKTVIQDLEKSFEFEHFATSTGYLIKEGSHSIMISAPHSVSQYREGKLKMGEYKTGVLAEMLHQRTGCPVIYKTKNMDDDANWDEECAYKNALVSYIQNHPVHTLYDLHISSPTRDFDIDLGTGHGKNVFSKEKVEQLVHAFQKHGIEDVKIDAVFPATNPATVSARIAKECGIDCIQIEINWRLLDTESEIITFEKVYSALYSLLEKEWENQ